jgi:hypothetical protein
MANLFVSGTANTIWVDFGDYASLGLSSGIWRKDKIFSFRLLADDTIQVITSDDRFLVAHSAYENAMIVDSVNGVTPTSAEDLFHKLGLLLG